MSVETQSYLEQQPNNSDIFTRLRIAGALPEIGNAFLEDINNRSMIDTYRLFKSELYAGCLQMVELGYAEGLAPQGDHKAEILDFEYLDLIHYLGVDEFQRTEGNRVVTARLSPDGRWVEVARTRHYTPDISKRTVFTVPITIGSQLTTRRPQGSDIYTGVEFSDEVSLQTVENWVDNENLRHYVRPRYTQFITTAQ